MTSVFISHTQVTDAALVCVAEHLQHPAMIRADVLLQRCIRLHQSVPLSVQSVMQIKMNIAVWFHTLQTGLFSFALPSDARITLHICGSTWMKSWSCVLHHCGCAGTGSTWLSFVSVEVWLWHWQCRIKILRTRVWFQPRRKGSDSEDCYWQNHWKKPSYVLSQ